jgi:hypothetical protein
MFEARPHNPEPAKTHMMFNAAQSAISGGKKVSRIAEIARLRMGGIVCYWLAFGCSLGVMDALSRRLDQIFTFRGLFATAIMLSIPAGFFFLGKHNMAKARAVKNQVG